MSFLNQMLSDIFSLTFTVSMSHISTLINRVNSVCNVVLSSDIQQIHQDIFEMYCLLSLKDISSVSSLIEADTITLQKMTVTHMLDLHPRYCTCTKLNGNNHIERLGGRLV